MSVAEEHVRNLITSGRTADGRVSLTDTAKLVLAIVGEPLTSVGGAISLEELKNKVRRLVWDASGIKVKKVFECNLLPTVLDKLIGVSLPGATWDLISAQLTAPPLVATERPEREERTDDDAPADSIAIPAGPYLEGPFLDRSASEYALMLVERDTHIQRLEQSVRKWKTR